MRTSVPPLMPRWQVCRNAQPPVPTRRGGGPTKALAQATEAFAALRMNKGIASALAGKNVENI